MIRRALGLALLSVALLGAPGAAQDALERADSLASSGRAEEARAALSSWWSAEGPKAARPALQRGLWLRGLLTVDPGQAARDYQRLVVEYPGGPFTDGALLRLAQYERAAGRPGRALEYLRVLARDYPSSPHRLRARSLMAGVEGEAAAAPPVEAARVPTAAVAPLDTADTAGTDRPDPATARSEPPPTASATPLPAEAPPTARATPPREVPTAAPIRPSGDFAVQLGAFSSSARAEALVARARDAGLAPRIVRVPGSTLARVRTGRFREQDEATRRGEALRALGFDALVVSDVAREEAVP